MYYSLMFSPLSVDFVYILSIIPGHTFHLLGKHLTNKSNKLLNKQYERPPISQNNTDLQIQLMKPNP